MSDQIIYELGYLLRNEADNGPVLESLKKFDAEIVRQSEPKSLKLAYEIKKQDSAQFAYLHFKPSNLDTLKALSDELRMKTEILRFLIIKLPRIKDKKTTGEKSPTKKPESIDKLSNKKLEEKLEELVT